MMKSLKLNDPLPGVLSAASLLGTRGRVAESGCASGEAGGGDAYERSVRVGDGGAGSSCEGAVSVGVGGVTVGSFGTAGCEEAGVPELGLVFMGDPDIWRVCAYLLYIWDILPSEN